MVNLSPEEKRSLSKSIRSESWSLASAWLATPLGMVALALFVGAVTWAASLLEGAAVIQGLLAAASVLALPLVAWLWLLTTAWKRKAFALQARVNAKNAELMARTPSQLLLAFQRKCGRLVDELDKSKDTGDLVYFAGVIPRVHALLREHFKTPQYRSHKANWEDHARRATTYAMEARPPEPKRAIEIGYEFLATLQRLTLKEEMRLDPPLEGEGGPENA